MSNSNCANVCRHASVAWCRSLITSLASITQLRSLPLSEIQAPNPTDASLENSQLLCVDLQTNELWNSSFEDKSHLKVLEAKWNPVLSKIKSIIIKKALDENLDTAYSLLRNSYNFYRESSCVTLPSGVSLCLVLSRLATAAQFQLGIDGVETVDLSIPRKLLLRAYTLLQGRCANISVVVKHCEENLKSKMKKGTGTSPVPTNTSIQTSITTCTGGAKDHGGGTESEITPVTVMTTSVAHSSGSVSTSENAQYVLALPNAADSQKSLIGASPLQLCINNAAERSPADAAGGGDNQDRG